MAEQRTAAERAEAAAARAWAKDQGITVKDKGRIPAGVLAAYRAAGGPGDDDQGAGDGPDWAAAGAQIGAAPGPGSGLADEPDADPQAPPTVSLPGAQQAEPPRPPTSLEDVRARLGGAGRARTLPGWAKPRKGKEREPAPEPEPIEITREVTNDITGKLALLLTMPLQAWATVDPICGGAAVDNLDNIVRKAVPLICLSQDAVRFFSSATKFMIVLAFLNACQPVAETAYQHHVNKTLMMLPDGRIVRGELQHDGTVRWPPDVAAAAAAAGPPGQPDYSMYPTQAAGHVPPVPAYG